MAKTLAKLVQKYECPLCGGHKTTDVYVVTIVDKRGNHWCSNEVPIEDIATIRLKRLTKSDVSEHVFRITTRQLIEYYELPSVK